MTKETEKKFKESKELLLKDLCARLPYRVICEFYDGKRTIVKEMGISGLHDFMFDNMEAKPYLRSMDSMTEEESDEWAQVESDEWGINSIDWLNAHHFDYRGLIEKGLALEAPEGMYD